VIDPHKHGLQPYGCGCVLSARQRWGRFYKHDSPYTYFTSKQLHLHPSEQKSLAGDPVHLGEISLGVLAGRGLGGSAVGYAAALALTPGGEFARGLACGRAAALELDRRLRGDGRFEPLAAGSPELDIVAWKVKAETAERASALAQRVLWHVHTGFASGLVQLPLSWFVPADCAVSKVETGLVTCLRSVLMKPEHEAWLDRIWDRLTAACTDVLKNKFDGRIANDWG